MSANNCEYNSLEGRLRQVLIQLRYVSSMGLGRRGLAQHHIDALVEDLLPFINNECLKVDLQQDYTSYEHLPCDYCGELRDDRHDHLACAKWITAIAQAKRYFPPFRSRSAQDHEFLRRIVLDSHKL